VGRDEEKPAQSRTTTREVRTDSYSQLLNTGLVCVILSGSARPESYRKAQISGSHAAEPSVDPSAISTRQEFAAALTLLRERARLTVRDVARAMAVPDSTIGGYFADLGAG